MRARRSRGWINNWSGWCNSGPNWCWRRAAGAAGHLGVDEELLAASQPRPLPARSLRAVLSEVASGCRALVREPRIAFLGPLYSFSHLAAIHCFGQSVEFVPVGTIAAVFEEVCRKQSDFGMVPLENSTDGRVADTLDMFARTGVRICGEVELQIHHALLGKCPRTEVREVYSKPQALSQCRNWLAKHLPSARTIEVTSTSTAAQLACEKPGAAAIASLQAGLHYGLETLAENIEDNPSQYDAICRDRRPRSAADRQRPHGHVVSAGPSPRHAGRRDGDLQAEQAEPDVDRVVSDSRAGAGILVFRGDGRARERARLRRAVAALGRKTLRLEILGSFPASEPVE